MSELANPPATASVFSRVWFKLSLLAACVYKGQTDKFAMLYAQALLETRRFSTDHFKDGRSPFGMGHPSPRSLGPSTTGGEVGATYGSYWDACMDRLEWDDRHGTAGLYATGNNYMNAVQRAGYNASPDYADRVAMMYPEVPGWMKWFVLSPTASSKSAELLGRYAEPIRRAGWVALTLGLIALVVWAIVFVYKTARKRS